MLFGRKYAVRGRFQRQIEDHPVAGGLARNLLACHHIYQFRELLVD
jgi:hypothetical protein